MNGRVHLGVLQTRNFLSACLQSREKDLYNPPVTVVKRVVCLGRKPQTRSANKILRQVYVHIKNKNK